MYPGSTSADCLAFKGISLFRCLEEDLLLADVLCLFGDDAYLNTTYMATPYTLVSRVVHRMPTTSTTCSCKFALGVVSECLVPIDVQF